MRVVKYMFFGSQLNNTREVGINADVSFTTQKFCFFYHTRKGILLRN